MSTVASPHRLGSRSFRSSAAALCALGLAGCVLGGVEGDFAPLEAPSEPAATCHDGALNGAEVDVDCGGGCSPCSVGQACRAHADCASGLCSGATCAPASCADAAQDGGESDVDCGGPCPGCADGAACATGGDCQSGVCSAGACAPASCGDGLHNGGEIDVDCGGACAPCALGMACTANVDCQSGLCLGGICAATCSDAILNQSETDVDCGGPVCPACPPGSDCLVPNDCTSHVCTAGLCQASTCSDGVKSGLETDVDCGGPDCAPCANGAACIYGEDCLSGGCNGGVCGRWVRAFPALNAAATDVGFDSSGDVIFATGYENPVSYGGTPIIGTALVKYTSTGLHRWSRPLTYNNFTWPIIATHANGDIAVAITTSGNIDFGCGLELGNTTDIGIVRFASADGACLSHEQYGTTDGDLPRSIALAPNGDVIVGGFFDGPTLDIGTTILNNPSSPANAPFVARFDPSGVAIWARSFGTPTVWSWSSPTVAATPNGDVLMAGYFTGTLTFLSPCQSLTWGGNAEDGFVAKLDGATGACLWSRIFDATGGIVIAGGLGADASGNAVVVGGFSGTGDFGSGPVSANAALFVGKYASSNGMPVWSSVAGDAINVDGTSIPLAIDGAGNVVVTGRFQGPLDLGGGPLPFQGQYPAYVAKFSGNGGAHLYSTSFWGQGDTRPGAAAVSPVTGSIVTLGTFTGVVDFGTGLITAANPASTYLWNLGPVP